jgi:hypothetical protein
VRAWAWPLEELARIVQDAGLRVTEQHERAAPDGRTNAALVAWK